MTFANVAKGGGSWHGHGVEQYGDRAIGHVTDVSDKSYALQR